MAKVINFGCRLNASETEAIQNTVDSLGMGGAFYILNSCAVTEEAEKELVRHICKIKRDQPDAKVVVTGCASQIDPSKYSMTEGVDFVVGNRLKNNERVYREISSIASVEHAGASIASAERKDERAGADAELGEGPGMASVSLSGNDRESGKDNQQQKGHKDGQMQGQGHQRHEDRMFFKRLHGEGHQSIDKARGSTMGAMGGARVYYEDILPATQGSAIEPLEGYNELRSDGSGAGTRVEGPEKASRSRAFLQVQNGCNHRCTFCVIPYGRGNSTSIPLGRVVEQMQSLIAAGYNEIVLTGVDITSYGEDLPGDMTLGKMLKRALRLMPNLQRLRLSSFDVAEADEDIFDLLKHEERFMPYFHLSLQSGDNMILKRMLRRHTREEALRFIERARAIRPEVGIGADIIAGFPTETEQAFERTIGVIRDGGVAFCHAFPFSPRKGTPAALMPPVKAGDIKHRVSALREESKKQKVALLSSMVGKELLVLYEGNGRFRAENFATCEHFGELVGSGVGNGAGSGAGSGTFEKGRDGNCGGKSGALPYRKAMPHRGEVVRARGAGLSPCEEKLAIELCP